VTVDPSKLQAILDRVSSQQPLSQEGEGILAAALQAGKITLAGGDRAVAIGGNADNAVIVTGDRNILISKDLGQALQEKIQGAGNFEQQFGDRQTTINFNFLTLGNESANTQRQQEQQVGLLLQQLPQALVRQAYRDALPVNADRVPSQTHDSAQIVADLQDWRRLPDFVQELVGNPEVPKPIREKLLETIGQSPSTNSPVASPLKPLQSHLLIVLRSDASSGKFRVNGWLIPDDAEPDQAKRFQPLDIDESEKGIACGLAEVPEVLDKLLGLGLKHLTGKRYELTIEIFLPMDALCTAVDDWKICDLDDEVSVGTRHRVVVRSCERLEPKYLASRLNQWYANWDRVKLAEQDHPGQDDFEHLGDFCDCNWKRLGNNLAQKLGLKLTCGLVDEHKEDLFKTILRAATPIAVWSRCDLAHLDQALEIDALITANPLLKLSEAVWRKRQQADEEDDPAMHLGAHLGILWEDPYRLTPDAMMQLMPPGQ
jgi:vWA-MoxR associated protein C-terminal domain